MPLFRLTPFWENCKISLTLNTNISGTAKVLKLKFSGLSNFIYWNRCTQFQQNLGESHGELIKNLLSWHGMNLYQRSSIHTIDIILDYK